ncbi:MAG: iron-sulfur cluster assembly protein [Sulfurimonas sp.]
MKYAKLKEQIIEKLKEIYDPEIPVNLYDLGLIYSIDCAGEGNIPKCVITMTLTSATCPVSDSLVDQVRNVGSLIESEPDLSIEPNLVFDPPWDQEKMSIEAKLQLGLL